MQTQTVTKITLNGTDITDCCDISDNVQSDVGDYEMTIKADPECGYEGTVKWKFTIGKIVPSFTVYADDVDDDLSISAANLTRSDTTVPGTLELKETSLLYGTNTYNWKFTPEDTAHYETVTGTVNITVSEHIWEFAGFEWTGNEKDGYTAATAKYVCKNNADHKETVSKVTLTDIVTKPTCTEGGKTVYTAIVEKTGSLDGEKHTESKDAKLTDKLGHSW